MAPLPPDLEDEDILPEEEIPQEEEQEEEPKEERHGIVDRAKDLKDQYDDAKNRFQDLKDQFAPKEEEPVKPGEKTGADEPKEETPRTDTQAKDKVEKRQDYFRKDGANAEQKGVEAAKTTGKAAGKTAATDVAENVGEKAAIGTAEKVGAGLATDAVVGAEAGAAAGPIGVAIGVAATVAVSFLAKHKEEIEKFAMYVVFGLVIISLVVIGVMLVLIGKSGVPLTPTTPNEKQAATAAVAATGDSNALAKLTSQVKASQDARYSIIKGWDTSYPTSQVSQIDTLMNQAMAESNAKSRQATINKIISTIASTDAQISFGPEIATLAKADLGKADKNYCNISPSISSSNCTNFIYDVLYSAGVPGVPVNTDTDLWNDPSLTKVINRSPSLGTTAPDFSKLQPGDIVFFGDGTYSESSNPNSLFDHAGIYIGTVGSDQHMMIDSSSNTGLVSEDSLDLTSSAFYQSSSGLYLLNGAERYGK